MSTQSTDPDSLQPATFCIRILSRISTCAGILKSVLAICVLWLLPSLKPEVPVYRKMASTRRRHHTRNRINSLQLSIRSSTSTLVVAPPLEKKVPTGVSGEVVFMDISWAGVPKRPSKKSFSKIAPNALSKPSLIAFARRLSIPNKHAHVGNTVSTPACPLSSPEPTPASYFSAQPPTGIGHDLSSIQEFQAAIDTTLISDPKELRKNRKNLQRAFSGKVRTFFRTHSTTKEH